MNDNISKVPMFDPKSSFFELSIVRKTAYVILSLILVSCGIILLCSNPTWDPSYEGFNHFFTVFKFPLYGLGFLASLLALYATNHRSEQTKAAMALAKGQNEFTNYYKHLEEFSKHVDKVEAEKDANDKDILSVDVRKLHAFLFPHAREGEYEASDDVIDYFESSFDKYLSVIKLFLSADECSNPYESLCDLFVCRGNLEIFFSGLILGIKSEYEVDLEKVVIFKFLDTGEEVGVPRYLEVLLSDTVKIYKQIYSIMEFDSQYDPKNQQKNKIFSLAKSISGVVNKITLYSDNVEKGEYRVYGASFKRLKEKLIAECA